MQPLPISPLQREDVFVSGDVTIHANAAIAPGVVLQAGQNERIVIADGVCLGLGVVLHARRGDICIKAGANLGAGVLVIGACTVGPYASIGAASTIIDTDVAADQVLAAGTVLGDRSRPQEKPDERPDERPDEGRPSEMRSPGQNPPHELPSPWENESSEESIISQDSRDESSRNPSEDSPDPPEEPIDLAESSSPPPEQKSDPSPSEHPSNTSNSETTTNSPSNPAVVKRLIYGQVHLNQMLTTLFPHAQHLKPRSDSDSSAP
jgi:carbon dioxide concentrating mechanism protein CcmN